MSELRLMRETSNSLSFMKHETSSVFLKVVFVAGFFLYTLCLQLLSLLHKPLGRTVHTGWKANSILRAFLQVWGLQCVIRNVILSYFSVIAFFFLFQP